jgi:hypothetical protein
LQWSGGGKAAPYQQLAALPELHCLVVSDTGDKRTVVCPAERILQKQRVARGGLGEGAAHAETLNGEVAVLAQHADESVGMNVDEADEAIAAAGARHV